MQPCNGIATETPDHDQPTISTLVKNQYKYIMPVIVIYSHIELQINECINVGVYPCIYTIDVILVFVFIIKYSE